MFKYYFIQYTLYDSFGKEARLGWKVKRTMFFGNPVKVVNKLIADLAKEYPNLSFMLTDLRRIE